MWFTACLFLSIVINLAQLEYPLHWQHSFHSKQKNHVHPVCAAETRQQLNKCIFHKTVASLQHWCSSLKSKCLLLMNIQTRKPCTECLLHQPVSFSWKSSLLHWRGVGLSLHPSGHTWPDRQVWPGSAQPRPLSAAACGSTRVVAFHLQLTVNLMHHLTIKSSVSQLQCESAINSWSALISGPYALTGVPV